MRVSRIQTSRQCTANNYDHDQHNTVTTVIEEDQHLTVRALADALHILRDAEIEDNESVTDDE